MIKNILKWVKKKFSQKDTHIENKTEKKLFHEVFEREFCKVITTVKHDFENISTTIYKVAATASMYKDEERDLFLDVYFFLNYKEALSIIPGNSSMSFGSFEISLLHNESVNIIKKMAPLATGVWKLYFSIDENKETFSYGIFTNNDFLIAIPIEETLSIEDNDNLFSYIRITRECKSSITLSNHLGYSSKLFFSSFGEIGTSASENIEYLSKSICKKVNENQKTNCETYCTKLLNRSIFQSHGTLIAVVNTEYFEFKNCVKIDPPLEFEYLIEIIKKDKNNYEAMTRLLSKETLVNGAINSDGIVIFDEYFKLHAFNYFTTSPQSEQVIGGARSRAFEALCNTTNGIVACFIQSQDGHTKFKVKQYEQ